MAKLLFFTEGPATDVFYKNLRDATNEFTRPARERCELLWEIYEPFADREFLVEVKNKFYARYWEMYLTTYFISEGYKVSCPKPGPDVGIEFNSGRIWFEATSPTRGADDTADQVPAEKVVSLGDKPVVQDVPNEKLVLRYLNSISTKYKEQYLPWLQQGIIRQEDAFVIALNPRALGFEWADTQPPRILQAAFTLGAPYAAIDPSNFKQVGAGYQFRDAITKASGAVVHTGVFQQKEYMGLSGLLCSRVDAVNQPKKLGNDFQLIPNPHANISLPHDFRLKGTYFRIEPVEGNYSAIPEFVD